MHFQKLKLPREEVVSIQSLKKMCLGAKLFFKCGGGSLEFSQNFELRVSGKTHSIQFLTSNDMLCAMCSMYFYKTIGEKICHDSIDCTVLVTNKKATFSHCQLGLAFLIYGHLLSYLFCCKTYPSCTALDTYQNCTLLSSMDTQLFTAHLKYRFYDWFLGAK